MQGEDRHCRMVLKRVRELLELTPRQDIPIYIRLPRPQPLATQSQETSAHQHRAESGTDSLENVQGHERCLLSAVTKDVANILWKN